MNYCSLDFSNPEFQESYQTLKEAPNKESLIETIGDSGVFLGGGYFDDSGDFHLYSKQDIIEALTKLKEDPDKKIANSVIDDVIVNYNRYFANTPSKVLTGFNLNEGGLLTTILGPELNDALQNDLLAEINGFLVYDAPTHYIPVGKTGLNGAIKNYKNGFFKILVDYIQDRLDPELYQELSNIVLYDVNGDAIPHASYYELVMQQAANKIMEKMRIDNGGNKFNDLLTPATRETILNPVKALYVLNDFDNFIKTYSFGLIIMNQDLIDKLEVLDKYKRNNRALRHKDFSDSNKSQDAQDEISGKFFRFFQKIENGRGGYLTKNDFQSIRKHIQSALDDTEYVGKLRALVSTTDPDIKFDALIAALTDEFNLRREIGPKVCDNLVKAFKQYKADYNTNRGGARSIADMKELEHDFNFCILMLYEMDNAKNAAHQCVTPEGNKIETNTLVTRGKSAINKDVENHIRDAFKNGDYYLYNPKFLFGDSQLADFTNVFSESFIDYVRKLTGVDLLQDDIRRKVSTSLGASKLAKFIVCINNIVKTQLYPYRNSTPAKFESQLANIMNALKLNLGNQYSDYIEFTNLLIEDNLNDLQLLHDLAMQTLPSATIKNTVSDFAKNWEDFKKQFGETNDNMFGQFTNLTSIPRNWGKTTGFTDRIIRRKDYAAGSIDAEHAIEARSLVGDESASVAINFDFLDSVTRFKVFLNQIECVSDKPSIPLGAFNVGDSVRNRHTNKPILEMTYDEFVNSYILQHREFYANMERDLLSDYSKLFGRNFTSLEDAIEELERHPYEDDPKNPNASLYNLLYKYNEANPESPLQFANLIHYINKRNKLLFNNELYLNIIAARTGNEGLIKQLLDQGLEDTIDFYTETQVPMLIRYNPEYEALYRLLADTPLATAAELAQFLQPGSSSFWVKYKDNKFNYKNATLKEKLANMNPLSAGFIKKFFIMQQLATEADLQITVKDPIIHTASGADMSISKLKTLSPQTFNNQEFAGLIEGLSARMVKGKKRNNALVATEQSMQQGLTFGPADKMNIAIIESPTTILKTFNGQSVEQVTHDGGGFTNPIFNQWELASYLDRGFHDTKKSIGLFVNKYSFTQVKYADFVLTNAMIRDSYDNLDPYSKTLTESDSKAKSNLRDNFDGYQIMKKMNDYPAGILVQNYLSAENHPAFETNLYIRFAGNIYQIQDLDFVNGLTVWVNPTTNETITKSMADENGEITVFSLWESLGGQYSLSYKDNGILDFSEASNVWIADLISVYAPELKQVITAKLIDVSGVKSCDVNTNPLATLYSPEYKHFTHYAADTYRMGQQQDASHLSDESQIPALTQVLTALAFNGLNVELVNDVYNTLADILELSLSKVKHLFNEDKPGYSRYIAEKLLRSLQSSGVLSNAISIVTNALEDAYKENHRYVNIPYSSRQLFNKVAADFIAGLNNDSLRQKFSGIAIVQNPSHGIIGIYQDKFGIRYTKTDLMELAYEMGYKGPERNAAQYALDKYEGFISSEEVYSKDLQLGDVVKTADGRIIAIDSPEKFDELPEKVIQVYNVQRDLRARNIIFKERVTNNEGEFAEGEHHNLWTLDSMRKKLKDPKNKLYTLYNKANLEGLGNKVNPYIFKTLDDFKAYVKASKRDPNTDIGKTFVTDVVYKQGETILPNVHRKIQGTEGMSVSYVLRHGAKAFENKVRQDLKKVNKIQSDSSEDYVITLTNNSKEIVYTTNIPPKTAVQRFGLSDGEEIWLYNSIGDKLVLLPVKDAFVEESAIDGKLVTVVYLPKDLPEKSLTGIIQNTRDVLGYYYTGPKNKLLTTCKALNRFNLSRGFNATIAEQAAKLFESFKVQLKVIAARIPSQSFQSFMANDIVAFSEGESNDGYVNIYEVLFTGSDFDIKLII